MLARVSALTFTRQAMGYAKLFSSITESSLWSESKDARILFVSMLARADATGFVEASVPGLARVANLTVPETEHALATLEGPDPYSKNPDHEGRRLLKVPGGWMVINYAEYRMRRGEEERREYMRRYMQEWRARKQESLQGKPKCSRLAASKPRLAQAEAEAEASSTSPKGDVAAKESQPQPKEGRKRTPKPQRTAEEIVRSFEEDETYAGINVREQWGKMVRWCEVNRKHPSERRFVNWLNRVEKPVAGTVAKRPESNQMQEEINVPIWTYGN